VSEDTERRLPRVERRHSRLVNRGTRPPPKVHAVWAAGDAADGSLHGFHTLCGRLIEGDTTNALDGWVEVPKTRDVTCASCVRAGNVRNLRLT
jgi:hypothetical protein